MILNSVDYLREGRRTTLVSVVWGGNSRSSTNETDAHVSIDLHRTRILFSYRVSPFGRLRLTRGSIGMGFDFGPIPKGPTLTYFGPRGLVFVRICEVTYGGTWSKRQYPYNELYTKGTALVPTRGSWLSPSAWVTYRRHHSKSYLRLTRNGSR